MAGPHRGPDEPAAHISDYLALLPSGPDAVRRLKLHQDPSRGATRHHARRKPSLSGAGLVWQGINPFDKSRPDQIDSVGDR